MAYLNLRDMIDGGGAGQAGQEFMGGGLLSEIANLLFKPAGYRDRMGQGDAPMDGAGLLGSGPSSMGGGYGAMGAGSAGMGAQGMPMQPGPGFEYMGRGGSPYGAQGMPGGAGVGASGAGAAGYPAMSASGAGSAGSGAMASLLGGATQRPMLPAEEHDRAMLEIEAYLRSRGLIP